ncbi:MAG: cupin domain-containing protein [Anaerolineaceae bacterium]|nr:cupin domain-containing protein [Anaerolineaceae bacterium]
MTGYVGKIEEITLTNNNFRKVLFTSKYMQLVVMSLLPKEDIGVEVHDTVDQFFRVDSGEGKVIMNGETTPFSDGYAFIVPAGTEHNVINTSDNQALKLYTIYTPPNHPDQKIHKTREEAMADEHDHV